MWYSNTRLSLIFFLVVSPVYSFAQDSKAELQFGSDILPILAQNCIACHNAKEAEGGLDLESHAALMKGGDSGDSIAVGNPEDSYLLHRVTGEEEPIMPPEDNAVGAKTLNSSEIELLKTWIAQGAKNSASKASTLTWHKLPENVHPVYALSTSLDGQHLAFGYGNRAWITGQHNLKDANPLPLIDPDLPAAETHRDLIQSMAFSPDSQRIATGGYRTVKIWQKKTRAEQLVSGLAIEDPATIALSPDLQLMAYASGETGVEIVDLEKARSVRFLHAHAAPIKLTHWISNSRLVTCDQNQWRVIDIANESISPAQVTTDFRAVQIESVGDEAWIVTDSGTIFRTAFEDLGETLGIKTEPIPDFNSVTEIRVSPNNKVVALLDAEYQVHVFDVAEKKVSAVFRLPKESRLAAFNAQQLVTSVQDLVELRQATDGKLVAKLEKDYFGLRRSQVATRNAARQNALVERLKKRIPELETASKKEEEARNKLEESRKESAKKLAELDEQLTASHKDVESAKAAIDSAKKALAAAEKQLAEKEKAVKAAEDKRKAAVDDLAKKDQALAAASDSAKRAASAIPKLKSQIASEEQNLQALEKNKQQMAKDVGLQTRPQGFVFSADGDTVFVSHSDGRLHSFSSTTGLPTGVINTENPFRRLVPYDQTSMLCLTENGRTQLVRYSPTWELERSIGGFESSPFSDRVTAMDFSPDGNMLAVGSGPPSRFGDLTLINVADGTVEHEFGQVHSDSIFGISFSADGRLLASCGADKLARIFDVTTKKQVRGFEGHTHHVLGVSWSDDGQTLATAGADKSIKIWNVATGEPSRTISGFRKEVTALRFSGQTSQLLSSSADGTVRLHDANSGKQLRSFAGAKDALFAIGLSADNDRVIAAGQVGTVWNWQIDNGKLLGSVEP